MKLLSIATLLFTAALALGCGGASTPTPTHRLVGEPTEEGDDDLVPLDLGSRMLPPLPATVHETDEPVREALRLSREALLPERPVLADDASAEETARFMRESFQAWIVTRARGIQQARNALGALEHGEPDEYVLASALVGTLFSMLAAEIEAMPLPRVVEDDHDERILVREALLELAAPLHQRALDAFGACASAASGAADPTLDPWASYCDDQTARTEEGPHPVDRRPAPSTASATSASEGSSTEAASP